MLINSMWLNAFTGGIFQGKCRETGFISLFLPPSVIGAFFACPSWEEVKAEDGFRRPFLCAKEVTPNCDLVRAWLEGPNSPRPLSDLRGQSCAECSAPPALGSWSPPSQALQLLCGSGGAWSCFLLLPHLLLCAAGRFCAVRAPGLVGCSSEHTIPTALDFAVPPVQGAKPIAPPAQEGLKRLQGGSP